MADPASSASSSSTPFALRTVGIGVRLTMLASAVAFVTPFLPGTTVVHVGWFLALDALTVATALVVWRAPWERLLGTRTGDLLLQAWSLILVLIISAAVGLAGRPDGEGHMYYVLIVVYFSLVLGRRALARLTLVAVAGSAMLSIAAGLEPARAVTRIGVLVLTAYLARTMRDLLSDRIDVAERAQAESEWRASLLATVAGSARALSSLDPESMLQRLVRTGVALGFQTGNVCRFAPDKLTYEVIAPVGHEWSDYLGRPHDAGDGMPGLVRDARRVVVVNDYASHPRGVPGLQAQGYRAVVAVPIWVMGELDGCLVVATRDRDRVEPEELEALELLAALAGRALENALRFEAEQDEAQRLARLAQLKSDFVSNVSHELRTPLTVVEGIGQTLESRGDAMTPELRQELVSRLNANARSLHDILTRLLDFSRLEAGTLDVHIDEVKLCDLSEAVAQRMQPLFAGHDVVLRIDAPLPVRADPVLMERVLENLLNNAAKHTPPGTLITFEATRVGDHVRVRVADDGPGIAAHEVANLTERFFRGGDPNTRTRKGLGLGLALVSELLDLHGSRLEISSRLGVGTSFAFDVPLSVDSPLLVGRYDTDLDPARARGR